jgi:hypothetical protein
MAIINGYSLTEAEDRTVNALQDWLRLNGGDTSSEPSTSPRGDGRWVPLTEIFRQGSNRTNALRQTVRRLHSKGILRAYEIAFFGGCVKGVPRDRVAEIEREIAAMTPAEREALNRT